MTFLEWIQDHWDHEDLLMRKVARNLGRTILASAQLDDADLPQRLEVADALLAYGGGSDAE